MSHRSSAHSARQLPIALFLSGAALIAGCNLIPAPQQPTSAQRETAERVAAFADGNLDAALDKVDRERLLAARAAATNRRLATQPAATAPAPTVAPADPTPAPTETTVATADPSPLPPPSPAPAPPPPNPTSAPAPAPAATTPPTPQPQVASTGPALTQIEPVPIPIYTPELLEGSVEEALAVLRKSVAVHPTLSTTLALALLDSSNKNPELVKELAPADQQVLADLLTALQNMNIPPRPGENLSDRTAPLIDIMKKWQAEADMLLPRVLLASRVDSFGVFTPLEPKFSQGKKHAVILYCEVANFNAKKGDDGWFTTRLSQQVTLMTDDGFLVWRPNVEEVEDRSLNPRKDFYLVKKLSLPETLAAGKYILRLSVTDKNSNKNVVLALPIEITK